MVDAFARLVVLLLRKDSADMKIMRFTRTLSIIALEVVHMHSIRREMFDQKPFYRLFSSISHELHQAESELQDINEQLLIVLG